MVEDRTNSSLDSGVLARQVREIVQKDHPEMGGLDLARAITEQKTQLAQQIYDGLDAETKKRFPVEMLTKKLELIASEINAGQKVEAEVAKEGWIMRSLKWTGSKIAAPFVYAWEHPWDATKLALKLVVASAVVAVVGAAVVSIVGGYGFGWVENLMQQVGLNRLSGADDAAGPLGNLANGPNVTINPDAPSTVAGSGANAQIPGVQAPIVSPGEQMPQAGGVLSRWWNLWGNTGGPIVPPGNAGTGVAPTPGVLGTGTNPNVPMGTGTDFR